MNRHSLTAHHHPQNRKIDMTTGPIMWSVLLFALPIILGDILQQLYTTVDTLVIGRYFIPRWRRWVPAPSPLKSKTNRKMTRWR